MRSKLLITAVAAVLAMPSAWAQSVTTARFCAGDNPEWKSPSFDDSSWQTLRLDKVWDYQGIPASTKFGWYRISLDTPQLSQKTGTEADNYVTINLGKIDDVDETYLNGTLIGKTGSLPTDKDGYRSRFSATRSYLAPRRLLADKGNTIAVRVYSGGEPGGMYTGPVSITPAGYLDGASLSVKEIADDGTKKCAITLSNAYPWAVRGTLSIVETDVESGKVINSSERKISTRKGKDATVTIPFTSGDPVRISCVFTDSRTGATIKSQYTPKYILTPAAPLSPRFNTAAVYGVRPGSPVHYRFGVSGQRPMQFTCTDLPAGLRLDRDNGVLSGSIGQPGDYTFTVTATNANGTASQSFTIKVGDLIGLTPPMGWNSWNCWGLSVSQDKVMASANALMDKGLADYGYCYINVDDAWEAPARDADGKIVVNEKFPDMKGLGDWLHERGLKFGIYSSPGDYTCGGYLGSLDHERQDAESYNDWGVDYLKYDWCGYSRKHALEKDKGTLASYIRPYMLMGEYLRALPRDIFYSLCQYGMEDVWKWGHTVDANSWRTTGDITDTWQSLYSIGFEQQADLAPYAAPGRWNDPDMLIVGKVGWSNNLRDSRLTPDEQYTHISLWALLAANMLIGCDLSQLDDFTIGLLCNNEVNAVNQDILGHQGSPVVREGDLQIWTRPLADGSTAVGIFNVGADDMTVNLAQHLKAIGAGPLKSNRDLWRQKDLSTTDLTYLIPTHGVRLLKITY